jgi:hypothetical protein
MVTPQLRGKTRQLMRRTRNSWSNRSRVSREACPDVLPGITHWSRVQALGAALHEAAIWAVRASARE